MLMISCLYNLPCSIPSALSVLDTFGRFSGYKLNLSKSEMLIVNGEANENSLQPQNLPFNYGFVYFGVYVPKHWPISIGKISPLCSPKLNMILSYGPF